MSTLRTSSNPAFFPACSASLYVRISCAAQPGAGELSSCASCLLTPKHHFTVMRPVWSCIAGDFSQS